VGYEAVERLAGDPLNTIVSVKRHMGRSLDEARREGDAYEFAAGDGPARLRTVRGDVSPVEVSACILQALRARAEGALGGDLVGAVVTVPAYFDDAQRQATRDAARLAGLNVLRLLNEPTAAALAYGLDRGAEGVYAVYDLGGGTFDISILRLSRGVFEVAATRGDTRLGGDDFDDAIVARVMADHGQGRGREQGLDQDQGQDQGQPQGQGSGRDQGLGRGLQNLQGFDKAELRALRLEARRVRERLSESEAADFAAELRAGAVRRRITRQEFEQWAEPLLRRTLDCARLAVRDAQLEMAQIDGVVMVGGATRMPAVRRAAAALFGTEPLVDLDPDRVVALGAALQANLLAGNRAPGEDWLLLDVTPLSLGLETMGGLVERVIPRNSTIPVARAQEFTTFKDGQTAMSIHVVQGERELVADCRSLARFELRGIPPMVAGAARIRVTFQVDADGLLGVAAREESTGVQAAVSVKPSYGLGDEEVARMLAEGMAHADQDARARALREQQTELARLLESVQAALATDADLLQEGERGRIEQCMARATAARDGTDAEAVRAAAQALSAATDDFAARRMDRSIRAALAGRRLDEIADS
jgi:molecular chaperone HscA